MGEHYVLNKAEVNPNYKKNFVAVDNFYKNPDYVREFALRQNMVAHPESHKGCRTDDRFFAPNMKEVFEDVIGGKIANWYNEGYCNGVFQYCTLNDPLVYHCDGQDWAGAIYLTPDAPYDSGTSFFAAKTTGDRDCTDPDFDYDKVFHGDFLSADRFDKVDEVGNIYNRLVIWNSRLIHAASSYFGQNAKDGRLFHLFFFDLEK
jgi:hypothetical protein